MSHLGLIIIFFSSSPSWRQNWKSRSRGPGTFGEWEEDRVTDRREWRSEAHKGSRKDTEEGVGVEHTQDSTRDMGIFGYQTFRTSLCHGDLFQGRAWADSLASLDVPPLRSSTRSKRPTLSVSSVLSLLMSSLRHSPLFHPHCPHRVFPPDCTFSSPGP